MPQRNEQTVNMLMQIRKIALAPNHLAEPTGNRQHDGIGDKIGGERPGGFIIAGRQTARDVWQRDVDDGRIENLHERNQRDDDRDGPGIVLGLPLPPFDVTNITHRTVTVGTAETPSGMGTSGCKPWSMTILTGTRCTILTKLPVAFSGGNAVNLAPVPSWTLST